MNDNLPMIKKETFFEKIKQFFKNIFKTKKEKQENIEIIETEEVKEIKETTFKESIKQEVSNDYAVEIQRDTFINDIEKNPELIENLSLDRLKKLDKYYDNLIDARRSKIEDLRKKSA